MAETARLDKWLWAARFFRTRALARDAITGGKVEVGGRRAKPGRSIRVGDQLTVRRGDEHFEVTVLETGQQRVPASRTAEKYLESPASIERRTRQAAETKLAREAAAERPRRPGKRERREIVRFTRRRP